MDVNVILPGEFRIDAIGSYRVIGIYISADGVYLTPDDSANGAKHYWRTYGVGS